MTTKRVFQDWTGKRFPVEIGAVAHGGHCVARFDGRVLFVRHALPGERVTVEVTEDHGGAFCRADAVEVLEASADRVPAVCSVAGPGGCGGCDWQHASAAAQRALKADVVAEQLRRLAGLELSVTVEELPGGQLGWRTRVRMAVDAKGRPGFRGYRSHQVIPVDRCPITVSGLIDVAAAKKWKPGTELDLTSDADGKRFIGNAIAVQRAAGREWQVSTRGFWQVHPAAADVLAECVSEWADVPQAGTAWDLYGGVGLFASVLAEQVGAAGSVLVVESSRGAVKDGIANLADLQQVRFCHGMVENVLETLSGRPDVVVLDPPRKGAGKNVVAKIAAASPDRVVYVACDPAALARDVAAFAEHGYTLTRLRAFDAFPMTHHVECVALLTRESRPGSR